MMTPPQQLRHRPPPVIRLTDDVLNEESVGRLPDVPAGHRLHVDLGAVGRPTAGGLGRLVALHRELTARGGGLVLWNVPALTYEVFEVTRLTRVLRVYPAE
jgi:anti-anti-sigma regulatory factor